MKLNWAFIAMICFTGCSIAAHNKLYELALALFIVSIIVAVVAIHKKIDDRRW